MTSEVDLSALEKMRVDGKPKDIWWDPPTPMSLVPGNVLAFDQSFSSTGWVHLVVDKTVEILDAGTMKTASGLLRGGEQDLARAEVLFELVDKQLFLSQPDVVVYETPPKGPGIRHPEVSLLCALSIRLACRGRLLPVANVHAKTGKKMLTGNANADKKAAHLVLMKLDWIGGLDKVTNEGQRDSLMVGLAHLRRT